MKFTILYTSTLVATIGLSGTALAQAPTMQGEVKSYQGMPRQTSAPRQIMKHPQYTPPPVAQRPAFVDFPTPQELARMTPPDPLTEQTIKQHFTKMKERAEKINAQDRKQAEKYAHDFARYQKFQAEQLKKMMDRAEQQRARILARIEEREQRMLEHFRELQNPQPAQPSRQ